MSVKKIVVIRNASYCDFGGGERFPVFLGIELKSLGFKPTLISRSPRLLEFAKINNLPAIQGWWWPRQNWSGKRALLFPAYLLWQLVLFSWYFVVFIKLHPDVVHIQSKDDFIAASFAAKIHGARIIWTDHADLKHIFRNHKVWYKNPVGKLVYLSAELASIITVVSESELRLVSKNFAKTNRINSKLRVVYNGVKDVASSYKKSHQEDFTYCSVSRLVTDKGIKEMIKAFKLFARTNKKTKLIIVGDGPEEAKFKKMVESVDNISLIGYKTNPLEYLTKSDVYIHATYHEGFSVSLVEASMLGLPIISTNVGGNVEIIRDGQNGLLIPPKNVEALYEAMDKLHSDSKLRTRLGKTARQEYLKRFQFDDIVKRDFVKLYEGTA